MSALADTSVLVAACLGSHPDHGAARRWLARQRAGRWHVAAHTLVELYAVLTRLPTTPRISPEQAQRLIQANVLGSARVVSLSAAEYEDLLARLVDRQVKGGASYDAVLWAAANKAGVDRLVTLNLSDFQRLAASGGPAVVLPDEAVD